MAEHQKLNAEAHKLIWDRCLARAPALIAPIGSLGVVATFIARLIGR